MTGYHIMDDGSPPPPCSPLPPNPALRSPPRYRDEPSPSPALYALREIPRYQPGPIVSRPATSSSGSYKQRLQVVVFPPAIPFNPHVSNDKYVDIPYHEFAEQSPNDGNLVAGSPAQERDNSLQAKTLKRSINSRTPSPKPPPPKRRPQRSEKSRVLSIRQKLSAMRMSNSISPQVAGSPAKQQDIVGQASSRIAPRKSSPIAPSPERRPQRSEKARALPVRQRLLAMQTSDCVIPQVAGSPAKQQDIVGQASSGIAPRKSSPIAPSPERRPQRSEKARALPVRQRLLAMQTSDCVIPQVAGSPAKQQDKVRQPSSSERKVTPKTSSPVAPSPERRPRRSERARALPARHRLLAGASAMSQSQIDISEELINPESPSPTHTGIKGRLRRHQSHT